MAYIINNQSVTIIENNAVATCSLDDFEFAEEVLAALRRGDEQTALSLINQDRAIKDWVNDQETMRVVDRNVQFRESEFDEWRPVHNALIDRIVEMRKQGFDPEPMIKFLFNINMNPSENSKRELYGFLETNRLPVTMDGHFLAYKKVRHDFKDCHSGTKDNSPGKTVSMPRNQVDADRTRTCSRGLHVCSGGYLSHFGGSRTMLIKVHPQDVVSVPTDYKNSKMRCCKYYVVKELGEEDVEKVAVYVS
jgi:hypothetical protein